MNEVNNNFTNLIEYLQVLAELKKAGHIVTTEINEAMAEIKKQIYV